MQSHLLPDGKIDWPQVAANLRANQGEFILIKENTHSGTAQYLRNRETPVLWDLGGTIEVKMSNTRYEQGRRRLDVHARWTPAEEEK